MEGEESTLSEMVRGCKRDTGCDCLSLRLLIMCPQLQSFSG